MMKRLVVLIALCGLMLPAYAKEYVSSFGFSINVPGDWLVMTSQEMKSNADMFDLSGNDKYKGMDPNLLKKIEQMVKTGRVEFYFNRSTGSGGFADNINMMKQIGHIPETGAQLQPLCKALPGELSHAFGRTIHMFQCRLTKIGGMPALLTEFDGMVAGTRSIQYQMQSSPNVKVIATATSKLSALPKIRGEFDAMLQSIKPAQQGSVQ